LQKLDTISIVVVCDNHYIILLATLIKSIEVNHHSFEKIDIYIVEDNVSNKNKIKLLSSIETELITLHWLEIKTCIPKHIRLPLDRSSYPLNIYVRLFIPYFLPPGISKVIYMDVDMIVQSDISNLWNIDLGDKIVAAVMDPSVKTVSNNWGGIKNYQELGLSACTKYFNSGLLIIKTQKLLKLNITEKIISCIVSNKQYAKYPDQYGLNVVLANQWLEIDSRWNHFASDNSREYEPFIIHFVGRKPIYKSYRNHNIYKNLFYRYLLSTKWQYFQPIGESCRYIKKIKNLVKKVSILHLPHLLHN
jgi:lipopolysaccharide biosynthesis glycosyltransferase